MFIVTCSGAAGGGRGVGRGGGGRGRGGRGRGRGGRGAKTPAPTAEELDADLDAYKQVWPINAPLSLCTSLLSFPTG